MKKTLVFFCGLMSLNVIAQPIPVSSLGNVAYTVNENGTPIPNDTVTTKNGKAPFILGVNTFTPEQPPGFETPAQSNSTDNQTTPETPQVIPQNLLSNLPNDVKELIKGKKTGTTINETNNSNSNSSTSQTLGNSQGLTGVTLQTAPIAFSTSRGYIEDWNKTTLEEHTKKGEEITQKKYGEFINKK